LRVCVDASVTDNAGVVFGLIENAFSKPSEAVGRIAIQSLRRQRAWLSRDLATVIGGGRDWAGSGDTEQGAQQISDRTDCITNKDGPWSFGLLNDISNTSIARTDENYLLVFDEKLVGLYLRYLRCDLGWNRVKLNVLWHRVANSFGCFGLRLRYVQILQHYFSDDKFLLGGQIDGAWGRSDCRWGRRLSRDLNRKRTQRDECGRGDEDRL